MTKRVFLIVISLVVALSLIGSGCGPAATPEPEPTEPPAAEPTEPPAEEPTEAPAEDELVRPLVIAWPVTPPTIDGDFAGGYSQAVAFNTCEQLLDYKREKNEHGWYRSLTEAQLREEFEPRLAESFEESEDGRTWTFHLRKGVKSNYGNELTAADVKWSYDRAFIARGIGGFIVDNGLRLDGIDSVKVVDDYTIQMTSAEPNPLFLNVLHICTPCIHDSTELKKHATDDDPYAVEWTATHNATFGAWQLEEMDPGVQAVFTPNPNYYRGQPYFSKVIWREIPVSANRMALLQAGDIDIALRLTGREREQLAGDPNLRIPKVQTNLTNQWRFNFNVEPFDNKLVRQAMAYAIPYDDILEKVYYGSADRMLSFFMPWAPGYNPDPWVYEEDLEKAKALLEEAGYPDGFETSVALSGGWPEYEELAVQIKSNLAKIGVTLNIDKMPESKFNENRYARTLPSTIDYDQAQVPIGPFPVQLLFGSGDTGVSNFGNYSNPEIEALIDAGWAERDADKRNEILGEMQAIIAEEVAWAYLGVTGTAEAMKSSIEGWCWYPDNYIRWFDLYEE
jgi:ABC-type transport system substrate-binding protein